MHTHITPTLQRVINMRGRLLLDDPFFGMLAIKLQLIEDDNAPTAWTDGRSIAFNPAFVATLTDDELIGLIIHEVMHCACGHPWRRDARDARQWNVAADHVINHIITAAGYALPAGALMDQQWAGQNAEYVYDRLGQPQGQQQQNPQQQQQQQQQPSQGNGQPSQGQQQPDKGNGQPSPANAPQGSQNASNGPSSASPDNPLPGEVRDAPADCADDSTTEADWQQAVKQATAAAAARGQLPGHVREAVNAAAHTAVDWRSLLHRFITDVVASDYSWSQPSARYAAAGIYLPALREKTCGPIVIVLDTSGSVDTVLLQQFIAEINAIADDVKPSTVHVMQVDTKVRKVDCFDRGEPIAVPDIFGRGGTSFVPAFATIDEFGIDPMVLIYFTDMDGEFPRVEPAYPVLWAAYGRGINVRAPFGEVIPCE